MNYVTLIYETKSDPLSCWNRMIDEKALGQ